MLPAVLVMLALLASSCDKEKVENRPDLPLGEALIMDFSDFDEQPVQTKGIVSTYDNFIHACTTLGFWHTATTVTMALPVYAYFSIQSLSSNPEYLGDNRWRWSAEYQFQNLNYKATLTAERLNNQEFSLEMKIGLAAMPGQGVVWFDGIIRYDHTHAEWNLYRNDSGHSKVLEVVWNKDYETGESDLTYTYVEPSQDETGSYITMGKLPGHAYDAYYTVSLSTGMINIEWDMATKAGRVKDPVYFGDTLWHCWNDMLEDIVCPG